MATGGPIDDQEKMKTSGICGKNGDVRFDDECEGARPHGVSSDEEEDEISVGCPSPIRDACSDPEERFAMQRPESPLSRTYHGERSSGDEVEHSDERTSSLSSASTAIHRRCSPCSSEDEPREDEYFKPLKKLKMMQIDKVSYSINRTKAPKRVHRPHPHHSPPKESTSARRASLEDGGNGVKSFSILDILNHRPSKKAEESSGASRIVRPWDFEDPPGASCLPPPAHRGLAPPPPPLLLDRYHHRVPAVGHHLRPKSADFCSSYDTSTCSSSGRSSTGGSDCCTSPDILNCTGASPAHHRRPNPQPHHQRKGKPPSASPLDALFQMTSKTFDELNGEAGAEGQSNHLNLFNSRQQPKKKRKSRTAFTNHQIFELEKRFLYQKYLSPADRDEIAAQLGLTNAQVITWFQNRRAKLKRDMEELKKDVEAAKPGDLDMFMRDRTQQGASLSRSASLQHEVLNAHKSFLENVQNLGILKKKSVPSPSSAQDDKSPGGG